MELQIEDEQLLRKKKKALEREEFVELCLGHSI